ncbi:MULTISPECIES: rod shape-determining protein MreD [unclassified Paenibacillus]|uniref:rod shape-determining protein MreD n=1 Tax=unclassified Paenibacillus TaxID=185978 RepID=UPI001AE8715F|nr:MULTISPECIES: rod shape-determining protein MreD [unclassified Paenibacillus]MBP1156587.1 rod shape-determining protein MreD [Paenibacillus sp. PvP091]MBP1172675.1 rod shape-determining protein MreD [Paenibacillus sp. PvR098]MBP2439055.1 rod shape-determining protein MreD [Paenibacillus sp. PvP052]
MNHTKLWLILGVLFLLESTLMPWLIPPAWQTKVYVVPHFMLVIVLYIGLYIHRHTALTFGLIFGILQDFIHHSPMLGPVSFGLGLAGYFAGLMQGRVYSSIVISMLVIGLGNLFYDSVIFGLYRLFRVIHTDFQWVFFYQMLPSMLINLLFALAVYVPVRKLFEGLPQKQAEEE